VLICYLPFGDPEIPYELPQLYADAGVDVLEVGVPGADPARDGPTIAESLRRAAAADVTPAIAAETLREWRERLPEQALVWMTYADDRGAAIAANATRARVDGVLLPNAAQPSLRDELERANIHLIHFLGYDAPLRDVRAAVEASSGYVMVQAAPGLTGTRPDSLPDSSWIVSSLRRLGLRTPIALGIGISSPEQARAAVDMRANGVVVGSATVEAALRGRDELVRFLSSLRQALDA
jgi:tryptophan synthase alpha chain